MAKSPTKIETHLINRRIHLVGRSKLEATCRVRLRKLLGGTIRRETRKLIRQVQNGALARSGSLCAGAGQGLPPFPAPLSPLVASFLRCAPDRFLLTKPNTSCTIEEP